MCASVERAYVDERIYDRFVDRCVKDAPASRRAGRMFDVDIAHVERANRHRQAQIEEAKERVRVSSSEESAARVRVVSSSSPRSSSTSTTT